MARKQKYTLSIEEDYSFDLFGICCHQNDYRLCWAINETLDLKLAKCDEPYKINGKKVGMTSKHSCYEWFDEENHLHYFLLKNKDGVNYLLPEKAQVDYFLVVKEAEMIEIDDFLTRLKGISSILTAFNYNPNELKSRQNLIF